MKKPVFKPIQKTVATEIKHFIVDDVRRSGAHFHSVATRVDESTFTQTEVVVDVDKPYTLHNVANFVSIQCPHPIKIEMTSFGQIPVEESRSEQIYFDADLLVERADAGRFVNVRVIDMDIFATFAPDAQVVNLRTGETENITLQYSTQGVFDGFFQTQNNDATGTDFDGVMYCRKDDILRVTYMEPYDASGKSREVNKEIVVTLDFTETTIQAPESVPFSKPLNVRVINPVVSEVTVKNMRTNHAITQQLHSYVPILMGFNNTQTEMSVQDYDNVNIITKGKDIYGQLIDVVETVTVATLPVSPTMEVVAKQDVMLPLKVFVSDNNLPASATLSVYNTVTGQSRSYPMIEEYANSGRFNTVVNNLHEVALPGQLVRLEYQNALGTFVRKNVETIMAAGPECETTDQPDGVGVSAPVTLDVNGQFFLNGSFAGTIKLYAESPVRVTILKA